MGESGKLAERIKANHSESKRIKANRENLQSVSKRIRRSESSESNELNLRKIWIEQITEQIKSPLWFVRFAGTNIANITNMQSQICQKQRLLWIQIRNIHIICSICHFLLRFVRNKSWTKFTNRSNHEIDLLIRTIRTSEYHKYLRIVQIMRIR